MGSTKLFKFAAHLLIHFYRKLVHEDLVPHLVWALASITWPENNMWPNDGLRYIWVRIQPLAVALFSDPERRESVVHRNPEFEAYLLSRQWEGYILQPVVTQDVATFREGSEVEQVILSERHTKRCFI